MPTTEHEETTMNRAPFSYLPEYTKALTHTEHERRADYYYGFAGELMEGDGCRLLPLPGRGVPIELVQPLCVHAVERCGDTVRITLYARSAMVATTLRSVIGDQPVDDTVRVVEYPVTAPVLVRY